MCFPAGFPPPFPWCPTSPASRAVAVGCTSIPSGARGTVLLCRPDWRREGRRVGAFIQTLGSDQSWVTKLFIVAAATRVILGGECRCCVPEKVNSSLQARKQKRCCCHEFCRENLTLTERLWIKQQQTYLCIISKNSCVKSAQRTEYKDL